MRAFLAFFEPFILMLLGTVLLASLLPPRGAFVGVFGTIADAAIDQVARWSGHGDLAQRIVVRRTVGRWVSKKYSRRPMIIPVVVTI